MTMRILFCLCLGLMAVSPRVANAANVAAAGTPASANTKDDPSAPTLTEDVQYLGSSSGGVAFIYQAGWAPWQTEAAGLQLKANGQLASDAATSKQPAIKFTADANGQKIFDDDVIMVDPEGRPTILPGPRKVTLRLGGNLTYQAAQTGKSNTLSAGPAVSGVAHWLQVFNPDKPYPQKQVSKDPFPHEFIHFGTLHFSLGYSYMLEQNYSTKTLHNEATSRKNKLDLYVETAPISLFYNAVDFLARYDSSYYFQAAIPSGSLPRYAQTIYLRLRVTRPTMTRFPDWLQGILMKGAVQPAVTFQKGNLTPLIKQTGTAVGAGFSIDFPAK